MQFFRQMRSPTVGACAIAHLIFLYQLIMGLSDCQTFIRTKF
ncbi:hypothetical protein COO91_02216 [Nostoc flagelliforme CCNUN1]|uniref:Uncharacterized protein n=1 Tax=Nostoc flagelliforme CCNUN1 TaxID=2038116 RepID=A0A2K8SLS3_9NOSO|nr:hypothetical protein COO91_02216 [Nostoc flagelliforme CCNUN1]